MWGIIPAAGIEAEFSRWLFSKELLPVGSRFDGEMERPRAVSEYLIERMIAGGADKLAIVMSPGKSDLIQYYGAGVDGATVCYVVQPRPAGLCDAIFCAAPLIHAEERVCVGLPDTIWFPEHGLSALPEDRLAFLLFPVERPQVFDAVVTDEAGRVIEIRVKQPEPKTHWVWGAFAMPGAIFHELHRCWLARDRRDEYFGTLVNAYLAQGGQAQGVPAGEAYVDVGTLHGYREAIRLFE